MFLRCKQFGFDSSVIGQRLAFIGLGDKDLALACRLNQVFIAPQVDSIIERFYEKLLKHPDSNQWLRNAEVLDSLKQAQKEYLLTLGIRFNEMDYFESRLKVGVIHAAIGLPLSTYQIAFALLTEIIIDSLPPSVWKDATEYHQLVNVLNKVVALDMTLATETYHYSHTSELQIQIDEAQSRELEFRSLAETDALTGLRSRDHTYNLLRNRISNARLSQGEISLLMLDLDYFKAINDTYGHQAGDAVLKQTADIIGDSLRDQDVAGRYGGEEFIIGLIDVSPSKTRHITERIRNRIAEAVYRLDNTDIQVTASIGVTRLQVDDTLESLVSRADQALYEAKGAGRNRIIYSGLS